MKYTTLLFLLATAGCARPVLHDAVSSPTRRTMWHEEEDDGIVIHFGDEVFTKVHYKAEPKPFLYPLYAPGKVPMTRSWPQEEGEGEERDHAHHTSLWFAHGNVNGVDFWHGGGKNGGVIEFTGRLKELLPRGKRMRLRHEYAWKDGGGEVLLVERRTLLFGAEEDQRWIDVKFELTAAQDEVTFGDTKEGTFALRLHPALRLEGKVANGKMANSEGVAGKRVWGKRASWMHCQGVVDDYPVGIGVFEHPENFRHPTWWHARTYGLLAANPFGVHDFEGKPAGTGNHVLTKGETLELRYRVWLHHGHKTAEEIEVAFEVYQEQSKSM